MQSYDPNQPQPEVECVTCGRDGGPYPTCGTCHGTAGVQPRAYTLSDLRAGRAKLPVRGGNGPFARTNLPEYDPFSQGDH